MIQLTDRRLDDIWVETFLPETLAAGDDRVTSVLCRVCLTSPSSPHTLIRYRQQSQHLMRPHDWSMLQLTFPSSIDISFPSTESDGVCASKLSERVTLLCIIVLRANSLGSKQSSKMNAGLHLILATTLSMMMTFALNCALKETRSSGNLLQVYFVDITRDFTLFTRCLVNNYTGTSRRRASLILASIVSY